MSSDFSGRIAPKWDSLLLSHLTRREVTFNDTIAANLSPRHTDWPGEIDTRSNRYARINMNNSVEL